MGLHPVAVCYNAREDSTIQYNNPHHTKQHTTLKTTLDSQNYNKNEDHTHY
jgi:hypothetical protein